MSEPDSNPSARPERRPEQSWESWIDEVIRDAQARGEFDNLAGAGKPLPSRRNPFLPEDQQLAYDLIQNSGHTLPWIDEGQEIDRRVEDARRLLRNQHRAWRAQRQETAGNDAELARMDARWQHSQALFAEEVKAINRLIDVYNLKTPLPQLQKLRLVANDEIQRLNV